MFGEDGLVQSGLFSDGKLAIAFNVTNQASGFMSINGEYTEQNKVAYTKREEGFTFGEHIEQDELGKMLGSANNLHGKGIYIDYSGYVGIGYFDNGDDAPGNYIIIQRDGNNLDVGELYMKNGEDAQKGRYLLFRELPTSEKFENKD